MLTVSQFSSNETFCGILAKGCLKILLLEKNSVRVAYPTVAYKKCIFKATLGKFLTNLSKKFGPTFTEICAFWALSGKAIFYPMVYPFFILITATNVKGVCRSERVLPICTLCVHKILKNDPFG